MVNEVILQQFMITLAVVLVPDGVIRGGGSLRFFDELGILLVWYGLSWYPPSRLAFSDLFAPNIHFYWSLILL